MANRRELLYGVVSTVLGLLFPSRTASGANGKTLSLTITNESNAGLEISPNHRFVSENGDGIDIEIGQSGAGLEPEGKTEFDSFFTVTNPNDSSVLFGIQTTKNDFGSDGPVSFEGPAGSLVVNDIEDGETLNSDETVGVNLTVDFLNNDAKDIEGTVTLLDNRASINVSTGDAEANGQFSAIVNGKLVSFENTDSVDTAFEYGLAGNQLRQQQLADTLTQPGDFSTSITGLQSDTTYEYRAVGEAGEVEERGEIKQVTTDPQSLCFITTATVGESDTLDSLRRFRDESMSATPVGRALVRVYYRISPPIAATLERHPDSYTVRIGRPLVRLCGSLSDAQGRTNSRLRSTALGMLLTLLYVVGIGIATWGYAVMRLSESIRKRK